MLTGFESRLLPFLVSKVDPLHTKACLKWWCAWISNFFLGIGNQNRSADVPLRRQYQTRTTQTFQFWIVKGTLDEFGWKIVIVHDWITQPKRSSVPLLSLHRVYWRKTFKKNYHLIFFFFFAGVLFGKSSSEGVIMAVYHMHTIYALSNQLHQLLFPKFLFSNASLLCSCFSGKIKFKLICALDRLSKTCKLWGPGSM